MKALLCDSLAGLDAVRLGDLPEPVAGAGEVAIDVACAALNFPDLLMPAGRYQFRPDLPFALGMECAGTVAALGPGVEGLAVGQRGAADPWHGCFAERVVAPAALVFPVPDAMDFATAAAFTIAYGTVHHALVDRGRLAAGESVLVLGAAGGIGLPALEVTRHRGARAVAAAGGPDRLELATAHGADGLVDYRTEDLRDAVLALTGGDGVDIVFDSVGGDFTRPAMRTLRWGGRLLILGFAAGGIPRLPANHLLFKGIVAAGWAYPRV